MNIRVIVKKIIQETPSVKRFLLVPSDNRQLPPFSGGAHITTYLPTNNGTLERHYSLVNSPDETDWYEIAVHRNPESAGGSAFWHDAVSEGMEIAISYPKNHFPLSFRAKHHVFYAAGIGITPFLSMMADLSQRGGSFELHYAAKSAEQCAFYDFLRTRYKEFCHFYFSSGEQPRRMKPEGMKEQRVGTHVYFCGPMSMVEQFRNAAQMFGYPSANIHFELFSPPQPVIRESFVAELALSNQTITVDANQSLLEALQAAGIKAPYSCRVGGCGTCAVEIVSGEVLHYDSVLSESERQQNKVMMTCVSRAAGNKLVLKL